MEMIAGFPAGAALGKNLEKAFSYIQSIPF
jgi:hypothetical protein